MDQKLYKSKKQDPELLQYIIDLRMRVAQVVTLNEKNSVSSSFTQEAVSAHSGSIFRAAKTLTSVTELPNVCIIL